MAHRVVIIGGGFGGLYTARHLKRARAEIMLVDRRNFHLFQPLLYQTATGGLSPGDIASPLRYVLKKQRNAHVLMEEVVAVDAEGRRLVMRNGEVSYDTLVVAAGVVNHYFDHPAWTALAPGLKTIEDALTIRRRVLDAFERAEIEPDPARRAAWLTFVVVGAGPTGVELAGALGELAHETLPGEFRTLDPGASRVVLIEASERILTSFPPPLSRRARESLERLGVEALSDAVVDSIDPGGVDLRIDGRPERIVSRTVLWAGGVRASPLGRSLADATGCELDGMGRVVVEPDLTVPEHPEIFVIGDMAHVEFKGAPLPCIAPAAIQQSKYVARSIRKRLAGEEPPGPFEYLDKGSLATIGRSAAVAEFRGLHFWGFPAWLVWLVIHLVYLIEFENRLLVMIQWANSYLTRRRGSRLITGVEHG